MINLSNKKTTSAARGTGVKTNLKFVRQKKTTSVQCRPWFENQSRKFLAMVNRHTKTRNYSATAHYAAKVDAVEKKVFITIQCASG